MAHDVARAVGRFVLEGPKDAVIVLDRDGSPVAASSTARALERLFGPDRRERGPELAAFLDVLRAGRPATLVVQGEDGARHRLHGGSVDRFLVVRSHAVEERSASAEELARLRSGASLALVAARLVHDFNNLLTPILLLSSRLGGTLEEGDGEAKMIASEIHAAATLAASLMRDVLSLARPRAPGVPDGVDINEVVIERRRLIERLAGGAVDVVLDLAWDVGEVVVDRKQLEYALLNLVANACDAMPDGGRMTLRTGAQTSEDGRRYVTLSLADTGVGMTEETRSRAFESFFTTKRDRGGLGLGLASVQSFAREAEGHVTLESDPSRGTVATIHLPRAESRREEPAARERAPRDGDGRCVLVADPDEALRRAVRITLEAHGYDVRAAATAEDALDAAASATVDVALVDPRIPCRDPRTFLHRLRSGSPGVKIVFLAELGDEQRRIALRAAALPKAFSEDELLGAVEAGSDLQSA